MNMNLGKSSDGHDWSLCISLVQSYGATFSVLKDGEARFELPTGFLEEWPRVNVVRHEHKRGLPAPDGVTEAVCCVGVAKGRVCDDGVDNDQNGALDCDDEGCSIASACTDGA